jgi:hypothetical protein
VGAVLTVLTAAAVSLCFFPTPASAAAAPVTGGSWWWAEQPEPLPAPVGQPAGNVPAPEVPASDFAVAYKAGASDKTTAVHIDTSEIPTGSTVSSFTLTFLEDPAAQQVAADGAQIKAFAASSYFADGGQARPFSEVPAYDANGPSALGKVNNHIWTFDITPIVAAWVAGTAPNNGVVLVGLGPDPGFEVIWSGSQPPPTTAGSVTPPVGSTETPSDGTGLGQTSPATPEAVAIGPDFAAPVVAPVLAPAAPAPATSAGASRIRVAGAVKKPQRGLPPSFLLAGVMVIGLVGAAGVALGDAGEPALARKGSVVRTLERLGYLEQEGAAG